MRKSNNFQNAYFINLRTFLVQGDINRILPLLLCGILAFVGGILAALLPETSGAKLPETIEDVENSPTSTTCTLIDYW